MIIILQNATVDVFEFTIREEILTTAPYLTPSEGHGVGYNSEV